MTSSEPRVPSLEPATILARVRRRFVPFAFLCYVIAYVDRVNVSFVATDLQKDLGLDATGFGLAAGLFFLGYCLFEVPSNLLLERFGARRWIARIMIGWGLVTMLMMFVHDGTTFMIARVVLGVAEAGLFPGLVLYFTYWFPAYERARTGALFMMAAPVSVIIGAPVSQAILTLDGIAGLRGWQWLFLIEGIPAVIFGFLALSVLTDRPDDAQWLSEAERGWLAQTMAEDRARRQALGNTSLARAFTNARVWLLCAVFFLNSVVNYGMFLWLPKMLEDVTGAHGSRLSLYTAIPFVVALVAMVAIGRASDRSGHRARYVAGCALATGVGLVISASFEHETWLLLIGFSISQMALRSLAGVFWAIPPQVLGGAAAAAGIAVINAIGNLGGFVGPTLIGTLRDWTGGYAGGLFVLAGVLVLEAILVLFARVPKDATV